MLLLACDEEAPCAYDVDCPVGSRCVASACEPIQPRPELDGGADAAAADDAGDADGGADGGADAGPDASVPEDCLLTIAPEGGVEVARALDDEPVAFVRAGPDASFGILYRAAFSAEVTALRVDETGQPIGGAIGPLNGAAASPKLSLASSEDGTLVAAWVEDERVHAALVRPDDFVALGPLSETAAGTFHPSAARAGDGFVVAWSDDGVGRPQVSTIALDAAGVPFAPALRHDTPADARLPSLASSAEEEVVIVWQDSRSGEPHLQGGVRAADGTIPDAEISTERVVQTASLALTGASVFAAWTEPAAKDGLGSLHLTSSDGAALDDRVLEQVLNLDPRTSIAWDGTRLFAGWHTGLEAEARATVLAVSTDLEVLSTLALPEGTQGARIAADGVRAAVAWIETASSTIRFATLSCE
jgi:hypothetical protein